MSFNTKTTLVIGVLVIAISVVGWKILSKGGLLSIKLPEPPKIETTDIVSNSTSAVDSGSVLGESDSKNYVNPLKDIYVNPFGK